MNKLALLGALGLSALLFSRKSNAGEINYDASENYSDADYYGEEIEYDYSLDYFDPVYDWVDYSDYDAYDFQGEEVYTPEQRLNAFLFMIRASEHVYPRDVLNNECYNIFYGGTKFYNLSDHPVNTGEKKGVPLSAAMCVAAGYPSGKCVSTAAGAYQIIKPTWNRVRTLSPRLTDFSAASQDEAARRLLAECGALPLIYAGDVHGAIAKASRLWASLPGSYAQQNPKPLSYAVARYEEGLGYGMA